MTKKTSSSTSRREARRQRETKQKRQRYIALAVIVAGVVLILGLVWWSNRPQPIELTDVNTEQAPGADGLAWGGPEGAPVVLVDFSDFQCQFCGRHATETVPDLMARYGDNPNFRYEYRPFVLFAGSVSQNAAEAAVCAAEQNRFWPYHDVLFSNQGAEASGVFTDDNLRAMAEAVGMDMGAFNDCYRSGVAKRTVNDAVSEGRRLGVTSTPSFFLNGELISGAQPASVFIDAIDAALANAGA
ncbi:MAG: thioredoxin domain-containing protein [Caldilineales bacterium]|nr:thioredoxin domain-containing protein [Caldilineales bacterium]